MRRPDLHSWRCLWPSFPFWRRLGSIRRRWLCRFKVQWLDVYWRSFLGVNLSQSGWNRLRIQSDYFGRNMVDRTPDRKWTKFSRQPHRNFSYSGRRYNLLFLGLYNLVIGQQSTRFVAVIKSSTKRAKVIRPELNEISNNDWSFFSQIDHDFGDMRLQGR